MYRYTVTRSWPIVVLFIHNHNLMLQHDNAQPHVARIWKLNPRFCMASILTGHPLSMFGIVWNGVYDSMFQVLPISSNFGLPLKRIGSTFHRPQSTT